MKMKSKTVAAVTVIALSFGSSAYAAIKEQAVTYKDGDTVLKGFIVYDDASTAKRPGIVIVPTWWGVNKHMRDEAHNYASEGYTAFIADMYGDGQTADNPKDASALMGALAKNPAAMMSRFNAAKDALSKDATVDTSRLGAAGYSLGGRVALDVARSGSELKGIALFYTSPVTMQSQPKTGNVKAKLLVMNGAADPFIKPEAVDAFKKEMAADNADLNYISYAGAMHSYTDPDATEKGKQFKIPFAFDPEATKESRAETTKFFSAVFK